MNLETDLHLTYLVIQVPPLHPSTTHTHTHTHTHMVHFCCCTCEGGSWLRWQGDPLGLSHLERGFFLHVVLKVVGQMPDAEKRVAALMGLGDVEIGKMQMWRGTGRIPKSAEKTMAVARKFLSAKVSRCYPPSPTHSRAQTQTLPHSFLSLEHAHTQTLPHTHPHTHMQSLTAFLAKARTHTHTRARMHTHTHTRTHAQP
jgi:hypothetical protein